MHQENRYYYINNPIVNSIKYLTITSHILSKIISTSHYRSSQAYIRTSRLKLNAQPVQDRALSERKTKHQELITNH